MGAAQCLLDFPSENWDLLNDGPEASEMQAMISRHHGEGSSISVQAEPPTAPTLMCRVQQLRSPCGRRPLTSGLAAWSRGR